MSSDFDNNFHSALSCDTVSGEKRFRLNQCLCRYFHMIIISLFSLWTMEGRRTIYSVTEQTSTYRRTVGAGGEQRSQWRRGRVRVNEVKETKKNIKTWKEKRFPSLSLPCYDKTLTKGNCTGLLLSKFSGHCPSLKEVKTGIQTRSLEAGAEAEALECWLQARLP